MSDRIGIALDAGSDGFVLLHHSALESIVIDGRAAMEALKYKLMSIDRKLGDQTRGELARRLPNSVKLDRLRERRLLFKDRLQRRFSGGVSGK